MTVYEMIQELSNYDADDEIEFHVTTKYSTDVEAEFNREDENDTQEVTVDIEFDEDVDYNGMSKSLYNKHEVIIDLTY